MNHELPNDPREEMEWRVTALLLGELASDEAAAVREAIAKDPELAKLHDDLKATIQLVQSAATKEEESITAEAAQPKLSEARRKKLLTAFVIPPLKSTDRQPKWRLQFGLVETLAVLAIVAALAAMFLPSVYFAKRPSAITALPGRRAEDELLALTPMQTVDGALAGSEAFASLPDQSVAGVPSPNAGGSADVVMLSASRDPETRRIQVSGHVKALSDDAGKEVTVAGRPEAGYSDALKQIRRRLAVTETAPAAPPAAPAKPKAEIVLPSVAEADGDKLEAGGLIQQPQETTLAFSVREPQSIAAGDTLADGRFYRFSGGGAGGGGVGGVASLSGAATPAKADRVPVLGDVPTLGKAFREIETLKRDGSVLADNFAASDIAAVPDSGVANPQLGFDVKTGRGEKIDSLAIVDPSTGLSSLKLPEELQLGREVVPSGNVAAEPAMRGAVVAGVEAAQDKSRADSLGVNAGEFGTFVPQAQSLADKEVVPTSPAQQPAPAAGITLLGVATPAPTTPAVAEAEVSERAFMERYGIASAGEAKKGVADQHADPARRLNESLADGLRSERGRALVREGKELAEVEQKVEAAARFKTVTEANFGNRVAEERLALANGANYRGTERLGEAIDAPSPYLEADTLRRYHTELIESKTKLAKLETVAKSEAVSPERLKQIESAKAGVQKLDGLVENAKRADIELAEKSRPYYEKKRELEQLRTFERILGTKLAAERIDLTIPRTSMVEIVDKAQPAPVKKPSLLARLTGKTDSEAAARITIDRDVTDIEGVKGARSATAYDPYFVQTQFEIIQSEPVLGEVVESLDLTTTWAKNGQKLSTPEAVALLKQKLDLKPVKNTSLIEIRAKDENPEEAAKIANAVAETYREHRMQERSRLSQGGVKVLEERYQEQLEKITKVQEEVEALRQRLNISDTDAGGNAPAAPVKVEVDTPLSRKPAANAPIPQSEIQTSENNFSTFSLNVSDVSFKLAAASLEQGQMPDAASVRSEEFISAFDYRDPEPAAGAPVAFAWERSRYPFAHNRDLLRFSLKAAAAGRQAGRPLNVVLLLDNSGSMERADRVQIIREALAVLATQLQSQDKLSVITFARTPRLVVDGISGDKAGEVAEQVGHLTPQGGTNLEEAMNLAYQTAAKHYAANGINRVVVLTDGAANLGNVEPESLKQKVEAQRKQGIALDCFGIGWEGFNDDLLETLSRNGDGRYGFINSPEEAATDFVGQLAGALKVAASDVKVQVEFNPKRVTAYRQIGYAKHQLTKEQFRDNTVDAAEIAAQEAGNALYTVEVNPAGEGPLATVRVRYKIPGTSDYREQAWDVPSTGSVAALEHSSPAMRLAASASAFSEWLVASPFAGEVTPDRLLGYLGGVPEIYGVDERPKKLEWMIRQAKSIEGK